MVKISKDCDYFFHCAAAMPIVKPPFEDTVEHEEINVIGTIQCLKALKNSKLRNFFTRVRAQLMVNLKFFQLQKKNLRILLSRPYYNSKILW